MADTIDYQAPPAIGIHDAMTQARIDGHDWPTIEQQASAPQERAIQAGHTSAQIDQSLGYPDPKPLADRLSIVARQKAAAVAQGELKLPPIENDTSGQTGPSAASQQLSREDRAQYANSLVNGETKGPADFATAYADAHNAHGVPATVDPAQLPSHADLTDYAITLLDDNGIPAHPASVRMVKQNLADAWAETGRPLADIYRTSQGNASVSDALTRPQPAAPGVTTYNPPPTVPPGTSGDTIRQAFLEHIASGESGGNYGVLYGGGNMRGLERDETGFPLWAGKDNSHAAGKYQFEPATWRAEYKKLGLEGGMTPENQDAAAWDLAKTDYNRRTGADLETDLRAGNKGEQIAQALHPTWTSLSTNGMSTLRYFAHFGDKLFHAPEEAIDAIGQAIMGTTYGNKIGTVAEGATEALGEDIKSILDSLVETAKIPGDVYQGNILPGTEESKAAARSFASTFGVFNAAGSVGGAETALADASTIYSGLPFGSLKDLVRTPAQQATTAAEQAGKATIIKETGLARQAQAQAAAKLQDFHRLVNGKLPEYKAWFDSNSAVSDLRARRDNLFDFQDWVAKGNKPEDFVAPRQVQLPAVQQLIDHVEGVAPMPTAHELFPVADALRQVYADTKDAILKSGYDTSSFPQDYYRHMWQDQAATDRVLGTGGRLGSGKSLQERTIPTINEGIMGGLKPKILDPIENTLNYVSGMRSFLAAQHVLETGEDLGHISWSPSGPPVDGWTPLNGNGASQAIGAGMTRRAYAQPGFANAYNNWVGRGFYDWGPKWASAYDKVQAVSNGMTGLKLGLSGYHATAIATESLAAGVASGIGDLARGQILDGLGQLGMSFTGIKPIRDVYRGTKLANEYLGLKSYGQSELTDLYAKAGGRVTSRGEEYGGSGGNLWTKLRDGIYTANASEQAKGILGKVDEALIPRAALAGPRAVGFALGQVNDVLRTMTAPLFDKAIPHIKLANFADEMQSWIRANPLANEEAKVAQARVIQRSMDDRFGELVQDNLFLNRTAKQVINSSVVSLGWEFGTLRAMSTGLKDLVTGNFMSPSARWLVGFSAATAYTGAVYQYLKTGTSALDNGTPWRDLLAPRSGYTNDDGSPNRAILPGYQKDAFQYYKQFSTQPVMPAIWGIASAKFNPFVQTVGGLATNHTWMGTPITESYRGQGGKSFGTGIFPNPSYSPETPKAPPNWWVSHLDFLADQVAPISFEQFGAKPFNPAEKALGIRTAPPIVGNPQQLQRGEEVKQKIGEKEGLSYSRYENRQLATPDETIPMKALKKQAPVAPVTSIPPAAPAPTVAPAETPRPAIAPAPGEQPAPTPAAPAPPVFRRSHHKIQAPSE